MTDVVVPAAGRRVRFHSSQEYRIFRAAWEESMQLDCAGLLENFLELALQVAGMNVLVEEVDCVDDYSCYVKGIVVPVVAATAIKRQLGIDDDHFPLTFRHVWLRINPDTTGEYDYSIVAAGAPKQRGAFKATVFDRAGCWTSAPEVVSSDKEPFDRTLPIDVADLWESFKAKLVTP